MPLDRELRFWMKVTKGEPDACWPWVGAKRGSRQKRGCFWDGKRNVDAARWLWQYAFSQELRPSEVVMHSCDNSLCVNPRHLSIGTQGDNVADMWSKGRADLLSIQAGAAKGRAMMNANPELRARGARHGCAKLSEQDVAAIKSSPERTSNLAAKYGVDRTTIQRIRRGALWN